MKFEEVLPLLREGKKVRRASWMPRWYTAHPRTDGFNYVDMDSTDIFEEDWELYDPRTYMNFLDAVKIAHAKPGTKLYSKRYPNAGYLVSRFGKLMPWNGFSKHIHSQDMALEIALILDDWYVE